MPCSISSIASSLALAAAPAWLGAAAVVAAQSPAPGAPTPLRAPQITLTTPLAGGTVPQDRPVVAFRFAGGDPSDPLDFLTFAVAVDGRDRTSGFLLTATEAWGTLGETPAERGGAAGALAPGPHEVTGRICSVRGICGSASATVTVAPSLTPWAGPAASPERARRRGLLGALAGLLGRITGRQP